MRVFVGLVLCMSVVLSGVQVPTRAQQSAGDWVPLFNGKDLSGWSIFLDPNKQAAPEEIFQVKDGTIRCEGSVNGYLLTDREYENYVLKLQWRWGDKITRGRNSGVFVHVVGANKIWPKGVEAQLMAGHAGDFWLVGDFQLKVDAKRQDPKIARHYFRFRDDVEKEIGQWNQYEITCDKDTIKLAINGQPVNVGTGAEIRKGKILLQSEGAEIYFRDIQLKPLR